MCSYPEDEWNEEAAEHSPLHSEWAAASATDARQESSQLAKDG